ncbi:hypothetical protein C8J57DRAFT_200953 [Mycena rebaudengoi]|nr:hypothetical protein C8J57DRAFT_200953 [Mycena rebaudengoi]
MLLMRDKLAIYSSLPWFEKIVTSAWVRYLVSSDQDQCKEYRLYEIIGVGTAETPYQLGDYTTKHVLQLKHGATETVWRMDRVSNTPWSEAEFERLVDTCAAERVALPTCKDIEDHYIKKQEILSRHITEEEISDMMAQKSKIGTPLSVKERTHLIAGRALAQRLQDRDEVWRIDALLAGSSAADEPAKKDLTLVNERNHKANMEAVRSAEMLEAERKQRIRRERTMPTVAADASRESKLSPTATLRVTSPRDKKPSPSMKLNPGKILIEQCIESIEVDLGDF